MGQLTLDNYLESNDKEPVQGQSSGAERVKSKPKVFSISEINQAIRNQLENQFAQIWVQGEISNFKAHTSGHHYFSLKDNQSQIAAVMFKGFNQKLKFRPENGMEVLIRGKVSVYAPQGKYQIFCEVMEPVGQGALQIAFEQLKKKLSQEGLFDPKHKKALPSLPQKVAIVTSPTGAAIRDMLNVLGRRFKGLDITLVPVRVQGETAAREIAAAIELCNEVNDFDVMIVGRGGGSIEDLWPFNEEIVARAIFKSKIPIVSAVGHEIDFTISDFVADLRAPTPSAAAELIVKNTEELLQKLEVQKRQMAVLVTKKLHLEKRLLLNLQKRLVDPKRKLQELIQRCDELAQRLELSILRNLKDKKGMLAGAAALLDSLSPLKVLDRGYAMVQDPSGKVINSIKKVKVKEKLLIKFKDGQINSTVDEIIK